jgi:hypothetical protein
MSPPSLTNVNTGGVYWSSDSVSGQQRRVHVFERFCGSNLSPKYAKLNARSDSLCNSGRIRATGDRVHAARVANPVGMALVAGAGAVAFALLAAFGPEAKEVRIMTDYPGDARPAPETSP